ncbi:hypothetical protein KR018_011116 [Drosophila ironensis]|nr:hypothetical protein KR018_011116 [Drosophila ironensis]
MQRLLFSGFNAFGQHELVKSRNSNNNESSAGFEELNAPELTNEKRLTISVAWRYSALALDRKLYLRGLLDGEPHECVTLEAGAEIRALAAGDSHCLVLLEGGQLYSVKPRLNAELQAVRLEAPPAPNSAPKRSIFGAVKERSSGSGSPIVEHIACGSHINVAVCSANAVYGIPSCLHQFPGHRFRVKQLQCGHEHAVLLNANGDVYTWGNGLRGQLGASVLRTEETPRLLEALAGIKITQIAAGGWHSAAISAFGDLYTWGLNCSGQLGMRVMKPDGILKEPTVYPLPQLHDLPECSECHRRGREGECAPVRVFAGSRHTLMIRQCGCVWVTGWTKHRQLGRQVEHPEYLDAFQELEGLQLDPARDQIICGPWATLICLRS